jgi:transaldolase/glucose-6-phosphate isomerase
MTGIIRITETLGTAEQQALAAARTEWTARGNTKRLWSRDAALWTGGDERKWLGWLGIASRERADVTALGPLARHALSAMRHGFGGHVEPGSSK